MKKYKNSAIIIYEPLPVSEITRFIKEIKQKNIDISSHQLIIELVKRVEKFHFKMLNDVYFEKAFNDMWINKLPVK